MDTATHLVVGIGLAGLAHVDPLVAADQNLAVAVAIGTVAGSQAPDLDTLLRIRSNALYIRHHRGASHSLPALFIWTALITAGTALITGVERIDHLAAWVFAAVCFHVAQDLFNAYGTQALLPFTRRWIAWNIIHIFDPFIFASHVFAILLWLAQAWPPERIFVFLYALLVAYYLWRTLAHALLKRKLRRIDPEYEEGDVYDIFPTYKIGIWNIVKTRADNTYRIGEWNKRKLRWVADARCDDHPAVEASKKQADVAALLQLTNFACAACIEHEWGYEVRWTDMRYRHRKQYPFVAIALFDHDLRPIDSYVGWLSDAKLKKKLRLT